MKHKIYIYKYKWRKWDIHNQTIKQRGLGIHRGALIISHHSRGPLPPPNASPLQRWRPMLFLGGEFIKSPVCPRAGNIWPPFTRQSVICIPLCTVHGTFGGSCTPMVAEVPGRKESSQKR